MTAPTDTGVRIEGMPKFRRTLKQAGVDINDLKDAHKRAGEIVANAARPRAPQRTGRLAGSIKSARQQARARVYSNLPYAAPIHWGWPARRIGSQPFLSDAARATETQWFPAYLDDVQAALDRVEGA